MSATSNQIFNPVTKVCSCSTNVVHFKPTFSTVTELCFCPRNKTKSSSAAGHTGCRLGKISTRPYVCFDMPSTTNQTFNPVTKLCFCSKHIVHFKPTSTPVTKLCFCSRHVFHFKINFQPNSKVLFLF